MKRYCNGDIGFCEYEGHTIGILVEWEDDTVISVDCPYKTCGYSGSCKLYNRRPIGYVHKIVASADYYK